MKYQKATVSIINLGNEDILTCSGEQYTGCNTNWNVCYTNPQPKKKASSWGWWPFGGWFWHW